MIAARCADLLLIVHGGEGPSDEDWHAMLALAEQTRPRALLVFAPAACPGPNRVQRRRAAVMWKGLGYRAPLVLLSESRLLRGMVTATEWVTRQPAWSFAPTEVALAWDALGLDRETRAFSCAMAWGMAGELGVAEDLAYLEAEAKATLTVAQ
jgi:hypothetical protein